MKKQTSKNKLNNLANILVESVYISKEKFEALTPDEFKHRYSNWTIKDLKRLYQGLHHW